MSMNTFVCSVCVFVCVLACMRACFSGRKKTVAVPPSDRELRNLPRIDYTEEEELEDELYFCKHFYLSSLCFYIISLFLCPSLPLALSFSKL